MSMQNSLEAQLPDEYNEISQTLESADLILNNAVENAKTLFHTLAVSSIDNLLEEVVEYVVLRRWVYVS